MNRSDFQQLADIRITEAVALLALPVPMPDGAYYLAGYAVECALKACIAKRTGLHDFPDKQTVIDSYTHNTETLLRVADLTADRDADARASPALKLNWQTVRAWTEQSRYERHTLAAARALIEAITDPANGVLPWIKARW